MRGCCIKISSGDVSVYGTFVLASIQSSFPVGTSRLFPRPTASISGDCDSRTRLELKRRSVGREACKGRMGKADSSPAHTPTKVCRRLDYRLATSGLTLLI